MTKQLTTLVIVSALAVVHAFSKPMDAIAAEQIPAARKIAAKINQNEVLKAEELAFIGQCIEGKDPILTSFAAWAIGATTSNDASVVLRLRRIDTSKLEAMPQAFVMVALQKIEARAIGEAWKPTKDQLDSSNPFLRVETTRELIRLDKVEGEAARKRLESDSSAIVKAAAAKLSSSEKPAPEIEAIPMPDERYELLLSVIAEDRIPQD
jgi:hypothetical protein